MSVSTTSISCPPEFGILMVDDHELVRLGLKALMASCARALRLPIVWHEATSLAAAMGCYLQKPGHIQLVLLDLQLPDAHGLSGLLRFKQGFPSAKVVVLSGQNDPVLIRQALDGGAEAFLRKAGDMQAVVDHVCTSAAQAVSARTQVHDGLGQGPSVRESTPVGARAGARTVCTAEGLQVTLRDRQTQVLDALLSGLSNREIAEHLALSEGTVKNHISHLLLCFGVRSRSQLLTTLR